jgi:hypothetical protein
MEFLASHLRAAALLAQDADEPRCSVGLYE